MNIKFTERAVAFLDILGFKDLMLEAHSSQIGLDRLSKLMGTLASNTPLNRGVRRSVPKVLHPKSIEISDSIVLSTPLSHKDHPLYDGLSILVMRCAQIASILRNSGFLVTGAIHVGPVHHARANILGAGYQEAYALQSTVVSPAIVLTEAASEVLSLSGYGIQQSSLCIARDVSFKGIDDQRRATQLLRQSVIVNVFEAEYINSVRSIRRPGPPPPLDEIWLKQQIAETEALIQKNLQRFASGSATQHASAFAKWAWFHELFNEDGKARIEAYLSLHPELA